MTIASPSATRTPKHDAVRDDLAIAGQISWFPPRPSYVVRMLLARKPPTQET